MKKLAIGICMSLLMPNFAAARTTPKQPPLVEIGVGAYIRGPVIVRDEKGKVILALPPKTIIKTESRRQ